MVRRRPSPAHGASLWTWPYWPDVAGLGLVALSLTALLALFRPEGSMAEPAARLLALALGWLAALVPVWVAVLGVLLISHGMAARPWPVARLLAGAAATLSLLGLAALEADRRAVPFPETAGGGVVGRILADALSGWVGTPSTVVLLLAALLASTLAVSGLKPARLGQWGVIAARTTWRGIEAVRTQLRRPGLRINTHDRPVKKGLLARSGPPPSAATPELPITTHHPPTASLEAPAATKRTPAAWKIPPLTLFQTRPGASPASATLREQARIIEETLSSFNIEVRVIEANQGPAVTQFGLEPATGVPVSRITSRLNDLALRLAASPIRMEAPVPGRRLVGIEVPNSSVSLVSLRDVLEQASSERAKARIPLALGKDIGGKVRIADLARMPHLLIAGATGSGKSVCINSIVASLLSQFTPDELQLLIIDPKMVELVSFNGVPHLRMPVVTDMERVVGTLKWAMQEMERRYRLFAATSTRNIDGYNRSAGERGERPLPYLVLIVDELADLMMTAPEDVERTICRLAQLARATGIHLIVATQRPSIDVVTGLIKANFPARIAFAVTSQVDSRVILDTAGAERLLGRGDMLYLPPDSSKPTRLQGTFVSDAEIEALVNYWRGLGEPEYDDTDLAEVEALGRAPNPDSDELYERAVALAEDTRRISVSFLQRRLGIGYPRAARLMDLLEVRGIVASSPDGGPREVLSEGSRSFPD